MSSQFHITIKEITSCADDFAAQAQRLYENSFPPEERNDFQQICKALETQEEHRKLRFLTVANRDTLLGFSIFKVIPEAQFGYLWYICVNSAARGLGIGNALYHKTLEAIIDDSRVFNWSLKGMIFEVERPDSDVDPIYGDPIRRIKFYERLGARLILGYDYWQPAIPPYNPVPLQLMFHRLDLPLFDKESELAQIVKDFMLHCQGVETEVDPSGLRLGVMGDLDKDPLHAK